MEKDPSVDLGSVRGQQSISNVCHRDGQGDNSMHASEQGLMISGFDKLSFPSWMEPELTFRVPPQAYLS